MNPAKQTVAEFFEQNPKLWVNRGGAQGVEEYCLGQAICKVTGEPSSSAAYKKAEDACRQRLQKGEGWRGNAIFDWNDAPGRTVEDVIALCKEIGI